MMFAIDRALWSSPAGYHFHNVIWHIAASVLFLLLARRLLDARGAISVTERTGYIMRVRNLARACAATYLEERERLGFPLLKKGVEQNG